MPLPALRIATHHHKIAHVSHVSYTVYTCAEHGDQFLLELELRIRSEHPRILVTYYNKCLFHFRFSHWPPAPPLHEAYPLLRKSERTVAAELLANPYKSRKDDAEAAYASLSFAKALKKMIVYSLCPQMRPFGNLVLLPRGSRYAVVQAEPVLQANGDIVVALSQRGQTQLFASSVLPTGDFASLAQLCAIYVVPLGLRCHLYDPVDYGASFSYTAPASGGALLDLLRLSTGIELAGNLLWVKLIPNLQHLNNQTLRVARFIHDVDNKKYIVWPWALCVLQFGHVPREAPTPLAKEADAFSLISDFINFSINHALSPVKVSTAPSVPSVSSHKESPAQPDDLFGESSGSESEQEPPREEPREPKEETAPAAPEQAPFNIPRDQMIYPNSTPLSYRDPGAPLPVMPTPTFSWREKGEGLFSPIVFNPMIKSNIDTKYDKGGKFYVDKEPTVKRVRETSVGYDPLERAASESVLDLDTDDSSDADEEPTESPEQKPLTQTLLSPLGPYRKIESPFAQDVLLSGPDVLLSVPDVLLSVPDRTDEKPHLKETGSPGITEASNCLPLILRSINVFSIPDLFILNSKVVQGLSMDVDYEEDDFDTRHGAMYVKGQDIGELLKWLTPLLAFDLGAFDVAKLLRLLLPEESAPIQDTDCEVPHDVAALFAAAFPLSYRVPLQEFVVYKERDEMQMSFLEDSPETWDSLEVSAANRESFTTYTKSLSLEKDVGDLVFSLGDAKARVTKHDKTTLNLDSLGLRFWNYLNFSPISGPKKFQVLLVTEQAPDRAQQFGHSVGNLLDLLRDTFRENNFGLVTRLDLQTTDTRPDLEGISNGLLVAPRASFYKTVSKKLRGLAELIKLDLINKTHRFEFDRPLLLLFVNSDESCNLVLQIGKVCRNFQVTLAAHQLALVDVFAHVLPWRQVVKQLRTRQHLRYLSNHRLLRICMALYNRCPAPGLYTQLVRPPASSRRDGMFQNELFLHVAYERLVDKLWLCAAWLDPLGAVTHTQSWFCLATLKDKDPHELGAIIAEIWDTLYRLFRVLVEAAAGLEHRKCLVFTRVNSIIPDDELVHWKRLSSKYKDVLLVVLCAARVPKLLFRLEKKPQEFAKIPMETSPALGFSPLDPQEADEVLQNPDDEVLAVISKTALPSFSAPRLGMRMGYLVKEVGQGEQSGGLSAGEGQNAGSTLGLGDAAPQDYAHHLVYEVTLLSCLAYWNLDAIMRMLLQQFRKMAVLNGVMDTCSDADLLRRMVPWHVNAVARALRYLVHLWVDEV